ncbi:MAG: phosphatidate cytidylyltransferase [Erysipelotrichaceae bacterium]|nr:phosphatidate cytidylyltransferase [Erysipelotrichaceae bacterium]
MDILTGILKCMGDLILYALIFLTLIIPLHFVFHIRSFIFRKLLHILAFSCISLMILFAINWISAALASLLIMLIFYPVLCFLERFSWYSTLFVEKRPKEIKRSMCLLFLMFSLNIAIAWGIFNAKELSALSILIWGSGDAAAALIGIPFGKHKIKWPYTDGKKSYEGTLAMFAVSYIVGVIFMLYVCKYDLIYSLLIMLPVALSSALSELYSPGEIDTITVPTVLLVVLLLLIR